MPKRSTDKTLYVRINCQVQVPKSHANFASGPSSHPLYISRLDCLICREALCYTHLYFKSVLSVNGNIDRKTNLVPVYKTGALSRKSGALCCLLTMGDSWDDVTVITSFWKSISMDYQWKKASGWLPPSLTLSGEKTLGRGKDLFTVLCRPGLE